jgi:hypothetical protein
MLYKNADQKSKKFNNVLKTGESKIFANFGSSTLYFKEL